jgi:uncharacterized protein YggU (UPF0235/DUF167 family)
MYVKVLAYPNSKREKVVKIKENQFEIHVKEKAERNLANKRILTIIALEFNTDEKTVRMVSGHRKQSKMISIDL